MPISRGPRQKQGIDQKFELQLNHRLRRWHNNDTPLSNDVVFAVILTAIIACGRST